MVGASCSAVAELAKITFDSGLQESCLFLVGADDEDGVVSGDGADDFGPVFVVDACGDGLRASGGGDEDEEVHAPGGLRGRSSRGAR